MFPGVSTVCGRYAGGDVGVGYSGQWPIGAGSSGAAAAAHTYLYGDVTELGTMRSMRRRRGRAAQTATVRA